MSKLEELLQEYMICNDKNGLSFYSVAYVDDLISENKPDENELFKEKILNQLGNHTYNIADVYNLLSEGKITALEIVKHTSLDVYDTLMDELKDFDKKRKENNYKDINKNKALGEEEKIIAEEKNDKNSEETLLELSKKIMDFLTDAKEILVIKK